MNAKRKSEDKWSSLAEIEGRYVWEVLIHTNGNKQAAARILDVDRKTLDRMIKRHDISGADIAKLRIKRRPAKPRGQNPPVKVRAPPITPPG